MIEVKYFAADEDINKSGKELFISLSYSADGLEYEETLNGSDLSEIGRHIKAVKPIINYVNLFGKGIDLYDPTVKFGERHDYYGYITPRDARTADGNVLTIRFEGNVVPDLSNGLTVVFNKYSCKTIDVNAYDDRENEYQLGSMQNENGLPEITHIDFEDLTWNHIEEIKITFSGLLENQPINIMGVVLGRFIDIKDIKSFDMIREVNPIGDNLSINEMNVSAVVKGDFNSKYGQKILIYDNDELLETDFVKAIKEEDVFTSPDGNTAESLYSFKTRSELDLTDKTHGVYPYETTVDATYDYDVSEGWNNRIITVSDVLNHVETTYGHSVHIPDFVTDNVREEIYSTRLSPFMKPSSIRQILQQIAWATCCGIDTTVPQSSDYDDTVYNINLIPFFASDETEPDIVLNNSDNRILKTSVSQGQKYSKIVWVKPKYYVNPNSVSLGQIEMRHVDYEQYEGELQRDTPFDLERTAIPDSTIIHQELYYIISPFKVRILMNGRMPTNIFNTEADGWTYDKYEERTEIETGISNGDVLEIANQTVYPIDDTLKIAQLKKWYSNNNTLSATVVDGDNSIQLGKVLKIQLKNGKYFQGIITKIVRNRVEDDHTVSLEAHEWN